MIYALILVLGLLAGCLSGIVGTGASIILLPVLVFQFGPQQAVPIMAVAALMGNVAKAASWWRDVDWRAFLAYAVPGMAAAALGAQTLLVLPAGYAETAIGLFFLIMIPVRHYLRSRRRSIGVVGLGATGGVVGFLSGIVLSTGPLSIPAFVAYGLTRGALISTEAVASFAVATGKVWSFWQVGALPPDVILKGTVIGAAIMAGAFVGKAVVQRMSVAAFEIAIDLMLGCAGLSMLWAALT